MNRSPRPIHRRRRHVRNAVLLIAGRGSRLRPLTDDMPKCMIEIDGVSLLERLLAQLRAAGIESTWLVTGYLPEVIRDAIRHVDGLPELHFVHNDEWDTANNAISVLTALRQMPQDEPFLLCDGDILVDDPSFLHDIVTDPRPNVLGALLQLPGTLGAEEMKFRLEPVDVPWFTRRVTALSKEMSPRMCHGESIGVQVVGGETFTPLRRALEALDPREKEKLYYEDVFERLIAQGHEFYTSAVMPGAWIEIDTLEDLDEARARFETTARAAG